MFETYQADEKIRARWSKRSQKLIDNIRFTRLNYNEFIHFVSQLDIVLDPLGFGAGTVFYQCWRVDYQL